MSRVTPPRFLTLAGAGRKQLAALVLAALLPAGLLSACGSAQPAATPVAAEAANILVGVEGNSQIKRQDWSDYAPALFGMILRSGDLLKLESGSQATVACADLTVAKATGGVSSVPCKVTKPLLVYGSSLILPTRADAPADIPLVLSPRKTKILSNRPLLRWSAVPGASTYKVTVRGPNVSWSGDVSGKTELDYPDSAPALAPGASYKLSVSAGARSSDEEPGAGLGFTLLKAEEAQAMRDGEARIRAMGLNDAATRLLIANFYAGQGLAAEAIDQLEGSPAAAQAPAVARLLGDLYLRVGLNRLAEQRYTTALDLSQKANDIEGQAAAENALGLVYDALGNSGEASRHAQNAIQWYQKLGDSKTAKQIQDRLPKP